MNEIHVHPEWISCTRRECLVDKECLAHRGTWDDTAAATPGLTEEQFGKAWRAFKDAGGIKQ